MAKQTDIFVKRVVERGRGKRECGVCGKVISDSTLARSSHGKMHVKEGTAVAVRETTYGVRKGKVEIDGFRTRFVLPEVGV